MSRKLPTCAWCGGSLSRRPKIVLEYVRHPGRPSIGWHLSVDGLGCALADPLGHLLLHERHPGPGSVEAALEEISQRGPGRLVGGPAHPRQ